MSICWDDRQLNSSALYQVRNKEQYPATLCSLCKPMKGPPPAVIRVLTALLFEPFESVKVKRTFLTSSQSISNPHAVDLSTVRFVLIYSLMAYPKYRATVLEGRQERGTRNSSAACPCRKFDSHLRIISVHEDCVFRTDLITRTKHKDLRP
jgi:hypothetical protein